MSAKLQGCRGLESVKKKHKKKRGLGFLEFKVQKL